MTPTTTRADWPEPFEGADEPMAPTTTDRDPDPTAASSPCRACGTTGGRTQRGSHRPNRTQGFCRTCYNRLLSQGRLDVGHGPCLSCGRPAMGVLRGLCPACYCRATGQGIVKRYPRCGAVPVPYLDLTQPAHPAPLPAVVTPAMLGIRPGQPPTDPRLTPATVWAIAHVNAERATCWLVNKGWLSPDEAAALAYLSYDAPVEHAAAA